MSVLAGLVAALARLGAALAKTLPFVAAYWAGRTTQRADELATIAEVHDEQLRQAARRPRDRGELVERLRRDGL